MTPNQISVTATSDLAAVHKQLKNVCCFHGWADDLFFGGDPILRYMRPSKEHTRGKGGSLTHQFTVCHLSSPGTPVILKSDSDPSFIRWMEDRKLLFDFSLVGNAEMLLDVVSKMRKPMLGIDDYGERFEPFVVNSRAAVIQVSDKRQLKKLVPQEHQPFEELVSLDQPKRWEEILKRVSENGTKTVYLKAVDGQSDQSAVWKIESGQGFAEMNRKLHLILSEQEKLIDQALNHSSSSTNRNKFAQPSSSFILQQENLGKEGKFHLFVNGKTNVVNLLGGSECLGGAVDGGTRHYHLQSALILNQELQKAINGFATRLFAACPHVLGIVKGDYILCPDGRVIVFDLGLRSSGGTPAAFVRMRAEAEGHRPIVFADWRVSTGVSNLPFKEVALVLRDLLETEKVLASGTGLWPFGWNHFQGNGRFSLLVDVGESDPRREGQERLKKLVDNVLMRLREHFPKVREGL
jgi:hypothetical protein